MSDAKQPGEDAADTPKPRKRGKLLIILLGMLLLLGGGAAAVLFLAPGLAAQYVPGVAALTQGLFAHKETAVTPEDAGAASPKFLDIPEMALTLPNAGHPRQMRIKLSLELMKGATDKQATEVLTPRVYDALLTYLRTLRDGEVDGGLGLDRLRADLYRRLDLVVGPGVLRDVLITSLVLA
jgi:flagellar FliL protein